MQLACDNNVECKEVCGWRNLIYSLLDQGADGYAVWDATDERRFSRVADIGYQVRSELVPPKTECRKVKLVSMEGFRFDRYHYFEVV